ncbi:MULTISPECIES: DUF3067 family protein [unclassified Synechocystis]|uniref:DUF3067 family protein n=1 Tax=unclassified Synechocystis TaxID=2640012 RepID=UPI000429764F|nr:MULTISPECIES: DUF3067 family protein [unclassified Synechocystis]AIE75314.1 Transcriptional regulator [Synechocystis sp. PCC 6714]MCT0253051.1 DUF3067 family protein [Synechocystis sp. CS-94]
MTGKQLHQWIVDKWGYSFDVQLRRIKDRIFLQIMWRYLEQASFPLSEEDYFANLEAIAQYLQAWGGADQVQKFISQTKEKPRLGKAVSIPLELGARAAEWFI